MAVVQPNKKKVRPVLDFRELNSYLDVHTADADVCAEKIRERCRRGRRISLLDLRKAYLQIHVDPSLWSYQTVVFKGRRYCLTRLGFGLNIAPLVLKKVLNTVLSWDEKIDRATSPYLDDILVDESIASAMEVENHLVCKLAESVPRGARVLGMRVWEEHDGLVWKRDNPVDVPEKLTRRSVFSFCGQLTGHLPVCCWLRAAASYMKRRANAASASWDDDITDEKLHSLIAEPLKRMKSSDPAHGRWDVAGEEATLWVDASSLALGAAIEVNGDIIEDGCWLRQSDCSHINLAELDAVIKGLNLIISWKMKKVTLMTDSRTVYHWVVATLSGKARVKTKASSEMLIRRRLETLRDIVNEYNLSLAVECVSSVDNKADSLTRVPKRWLCHADDQATCGAVFAVPEPNIAEIHRICGQPGIRRTLFFCRRRYPTVQRQQVRDVVRGCLECQSIDPAPERWEKGELEVSETWGRLGMDICLVKNQHYLTLIDCSPSRYAIWRKIRYQDSASVIEQLESVFFERGAPKELLTDNPASFRSSVFGEFASRWGMSVRYRCANVPSGNGISERSHRTIKTILPRTGCSVAEGVYRYNTMPRKQCNDSPANQIFSYDVRLLGIDEVAPQHQPPHDQHRFSVGDRVWIRHPSRRCDVKSSLGTVTKVVSAQNVEVDGMPRHVRDLRLSTLLLPTSREPPTAERQGVAEGDDELLINVPVIGSGAEECESSEEEEDERQERSLPRRSLRVRRPVQPFQYSDLS